MIATQDKAENAKAAGNGMPSLLVVCDEPALREAYCSVAQEVGFKTTTVERNEQAFKAIEAQPIEALLMDERLSEHSMLELLRQVQERRRSVEVVIVTNS